MLDMSTIFELTDAGDAAGIRELTAREPTAAGARDEHGLSALMRAAYRGDDVFAAVRDAHPPLGPFDRILVDESTGLPGPRDWSPDGFTALHIAALVDYAAAAEALLEAGADPNVLATATFARVTPLGTCAFSGALGVARVLLEHGADPHIGEDGIYTVEAEAVARGNKALAELIGAAAGRREPA
jgi:ankyrin repeat protein